MTAMTLNSPNDFVFAARKSEREKSRGIATLFFAIVIALHSSVAFQLLTAKSEPKKPPMMMEVAMVVLPKPEPPKPIIKEPPPAPPAP